MLPTALLELKERVTELNRKLSLGGLLEFADDLRAAAYLYKETNNIEIVDTLIELWMYRFESIMRYSRQHNIPTDEIDTFVHMLVRTQRVERVRENAQYTRTFARICLMRVRPSADGEPAEHPSTGNVGQVLSLWFKRSVSTPEHLEAAVNLLYGPACWALYLDDVKSEKKLPALIWELQVPVSGFKNPGGALTIPSDFT